MTRSSSAARAAVLAAGALLVPACIVHEGEPYPLYPGSESPRPASEVARLFGPIATIDGQDVSRLGKSFALLPGCHKVRLLEKVGEISATNNGGYVGTIGTVIFALSMKANYVYEIDIQVRNVTGPVGRLMIQAWERAADGSSARPIAPARTDQDFEDCRKGPA
jgi:hypothetical protein